MFSESKGRGVEGRFQKALPQLLDPLKLVKIRLQKKVDIEADVQTPSGAKKTLMIEIKSVGHPSNIRQTIGNLKGEASASAYPVFAAPFIGLEGRKMCRKEGVGYLDLAGNVFLDLPGYYVEKAVDKNPFSQPGRPKSLFSPLSTRIIRALLEEPKKAWKLSELAERMNVSLGQTSKVFQRLVEQGYLKKEPKKFILIEPTNLLNDWRIQYRPDANKKISYYSFERNPEKLMIKIDNAGKKAELDFAFTSFTAAGLIAPFVRGVETTEWYVKNEIELDKWVKALDLRPVDAGANAVIVIPYDPGVFYQTQQVKGLTVVSNIQLYLDLYSDPARGREQAEFLRQEKMKI